MTTYVVCDNISLNSSESEKCFRHKLQINLNHKFHIQNRCSENHVVLSYSSKNMIQQRGATDDNIIQRIRFACQRTQATNSHSEYVTLTAFHGKNGYANASGVYVIGLRAFLFCSFSPHLLRTLNTHNYLNTLSRDSPVLIIQ